MLLYLIFDLILFVYFQRVLFAGEATESERYGTVDGAIKSGWKAASRLINHYTKSSRASSPAT